MLIIVLGLLQMHALTTYPVQFDEDHIPIEPRIAAMSDALCAHFKQGYGQFQLQAMCICPAYNALYWYHCTCHASLHSDP